MPTIAIIGGGFSGTLLALHLLRRAPAGTVIKLIERRASFGKGQAYSTDNPSHLLNVRVGGMSAFRDRPNHFLDWLNDAPHRLGEPLAQSTSFVPRRDFGAYVRWLLDTEVERAGRQGRVLDLVRGEANDIEIAGTQVAVKLQTGRTIKADLAVLATGNVPAAPPTAGAADFYGSPYYCANPWSADALDSLDPLAPVMLIGTGLTAVDVVMSLLDRGHRGQIQALSRRGLLPQRHTAGAVPPLEHAPYPPHPLALLQRLRREARDAEAAGGDWRSAIDAIRPFTSDIWQLMSHAEKSLFLRHLRPWWDAHRHRMAPAIATRLDAARAAGQFSVHAGRIAGYEMDTGGVTVHYRPRHAAEPASLRALRVINCTGPATDCRRSTDPLIISLLRRGQIRPDPLRLGLDVTANCALRGTDGAVSKQLFAVGPLTRGIFWEMMAVPDLRRQCELLAAHLAGLLPSPTLTTEHAAQPGLFVI